MAKKKSKFSRSKATQLVEEVGKELNEQQKLFAILYTTDKNCFGNASAAYAEAYNLNPTQRKKTARQLGYQLLSNIYIKDFIKTFLSASFTDLAVDNELSKIIHQNKQLQPKIQAIAEYNKLKSRIKDDPEPITQNFFFINETQRARIARRVLTRSKPVEGIPG